MSEYISAYCVYFGYFVFLVLQMIIQTLDVLIYMDIKYLTVVIEFNFVECFYVVDLLCQLLIIIQFTKNQPPVKFQ